LLIRNQPAQTLVEDCLEQEPQVSNQIHLAPSNIRDGTNLQNLLVPTLPVVINMDIKPLAMEQAGAPILQVELENMLLRKDFQRRPLDLGLELVSLEEQLWVLLVLWQRTVSTTGTMLSGI